MVDDNFESKLERQLVMADPVRIRIREVLEAHGPLTQADLAKRLADVRGGLRRHLTQMKDHGWIVSAGAAGDEQWAMPVEREPVVWSAEALLDSRFEWMQAELNRATSARRIRRMQRWDEEQTSPRWTAWGDSEFAMDFLMPPMTPQQLEALSIELGEVVRNHKARLQDAHDTAQVPDSTVRETAYVVLAGFPIEAGAQ